MSKIILRVVSDILVDSTEVEKTESLEKLANEKTAELKAGEDSISTYYSLIIPKDIKGIKEYISLKMKGCGTSEEALNKIKEDLKGELWGVHMSGALDFKEYVKLTRLLEMYPAECDFSVFEDFDK